MWSLQSRAIAGGLIWAVSVVFAGTFALVSVFDQMVNDLFNAALKDRHMQVVAALGNAGTPLEVQEHLSDPAYTRPYSGRYWQINGPETVETSRSLFDTVLALPKNRGNGTELWMVQGPMGPVRGISETITLDDRTSWEVSVAETVENLTIERAELRKDLAVYFGLVGLFMVLGAVALTSIILRPIRKLRREVFVRWEKGAALDIRAYPAEVAPLVEDIETLLERNREIVDRGRRQAADLAHALKTPSAALRNELAVVAKRHDVADAQQALDRIDAQICRSLARMRAQNAAQVTRDQTDLIHSLQRLGRLFKGLAEPSTRELVIYAAPDIALPVDRQDLEEMLGNIIENAFKWCDRKVCVSGRRDAHWATITIEDDGPGIAVHDLKAAMAPGIRLDTAVPGTGLGLSITQDLAVAYGGSVELDPSKTLGGLRVTIRLPLQIAGTNRSIAAE